MEICSHKDKFAQKFTLKIGNVKFSGENQPQRRIIRQKCQIELDTAPLAPIAPTNGTNSDAR
jgi:hypothetical protein